MVKICPMCGNGIVGYPALSRSDNRTEICSQCGTLEAMADLRPCNGLPRHCYYGAVEGTVMIVRGSSGYYQLSPAFTRKDADELNARWNVSKKDASIMAGKSMFGWGACSSMNTRTSEPGTKARPEPAYTGPYMEATLWGHEILAVYYNWMSEKFDVIAYRKDLAPGLIFARSYNPLTGMWGGGDYNLTREQAEGKAFGRCVWTSGTLDKHNWPGYDKKSTKNVRPSANRAGKRTGSKPVQRASKPAQRSGPRKSTKNVQGPSKGASKPKSVSKSTKSKATTAKKPTTKKTSTKKGC